MTVDEYRAAQLETAARVEAALVVERREHAEDVAAKLRTVDAAAAHAHRTSR